MLSARGFTTMMPRFTLSTRTLLVSRAGDVTVGGARRTVSGVGRNAGVAPGITRLPTGTETLPLAESARTVAGIGLAGDVGNGPKPIVSVGDKPGIRLHGTDGSVPAMKNSVA